MTKDFYEIGDVDFGPLGERTLRIEYYYYPYQGPSYDSPGEPEEFEILSATIDGLSVDPLWIDWDFCKKCLEEEGVIK